MLRTIRTARAGAVGPATNRCFRTALAALTVAATSLVASSQAGATQIDGTPSGFGINDASTPGPDAITAEVGTVNGQPVWRIVAQTPVGAVTGSCVRVTGVVEGAGPTEAVCTRGAAITASTVDLGAGDDSFSVAAAFPDPLRLLGGDGNDRLSGAEANDELQGQAGNDQLDGGRANDLLDGGDGDDFLNGMDPGEFPFTDRMVAGPGSDRLRGGFEELFLARDGVLDRIACISRLGGTGPTGLAEVDLLDQFDASCPTVSRAPVNERPSVEFASSTVALRGVTAQVRIRCAGSRACRGRLTLKLERKGARTASKQYRVKKGVKTVPVTLTKRDARIAGHKGVMAQATLREKGVDGPRTQSRLVTFK